MAGSILGNVVVVEVASLVAGPYCGKLLAALGARVIKVEPPGAGDPSRRRGPFPGDTPHPERSGLFLYLNTGKEGVTLNLRDPQGRKLLHELASHADVLVHDRRPGVARDEGLDPDALRQANPRLVLATTTPFGSSGPYADYRAHDLNVFHAGGEGYLLPNGLPLEAHPHRAPVRAGSEMGSYQGGLVAALGVLAALYARLQSGVGQGVDCSQQEAQLSIGYLPVQRLESEGVVEDRSSRYFRFGGVVPCQDGYVELLTLEPRQWQALKEFMGNPSWATDEAFRDPERHGPEMNAHLREWMAQHPKESVYHRAQAAGVPVGPYYTPGEVFHNRHQRERGLFVEVDHPQAGSLEYPSWPFRFDGAPPPVRRAPLLGEHNAGVYCGLLGYSREDLVALTRAGVV